MNRKILIVEDDKNILNLVKYNLEKNQLSCILARDAEEAQQILRKARVDLIVLDIMLPGMDGFEFCRWVKGQPGLSSIPVVMLTARGEEIDRIVGLELGADDYIVKPFSPRELVLRVKAVLRRQVAHQAPSDVLSIGQITLDRARHKVTVGQREVELTPMEFKLLATLMERRGRVQTRDTLLNDVWGIDAEVYSRTVDTHIKRLREKLGKAGKMIETVTGVGYRFRDEVDEN